ncbi:NADPH-dependent FMN reductase [Streptomyces sp. NPDC088116]|uniref:NADPH-dependent FMN reductase n=1 Tax=Streptomyces sp. NPDC088116 TaxID=3365825 RepID=UPI0037FE7691
MATILSVSGSPSPTSRTGRLLRHLDRRLVAQGHRVVPFDVRTLPAEALLGADFGHPAIVEARRLFDEADGVVVGTPVYKAAYSGLLKSLLDLLPQYALAGKTVLPLATGGSTAHVLAIDYALRPVLSSMGAAHIVQGWFVLDRHITVREEDGEVAVDPAVREALDQVVDQFSLALAPVHRPATAVAA